MIWMWWRGLGQINLTTFSKLINSGNEFKRVPGSEIQAVHLWLISQSKDICALWVWIMMSALSWTVLSFVHIYVTFHWQTLTWKLSEWKSKCICHKLFAVWIELWWTAGVWESLDNTCNTFLCVLFITNSNTFGNDEVWQRFNLIVYANGFCCKFAHLLSPLPIFINFFWSLSFILSHHH